jgi:hypothetical protein
MIKHLTCLWYYNLNETQRLTLVNKSPKNNSLHIHTYHSRFIPEGVTEVSQIFLRVTHVLPKLVSYEEHFAPLFKERPNSK